MILAEIRDQLGLDWNGIALELDAKKRGMWRLFAWCFLVKRRGNCLSSDGVLLKESLIKKILETGKVNDVT